VGAQLKHRWRPVVGIVAGATAVGTLAGGVILGSAQRTPSDTEPGLTDAPSGVAAIILASAPLDDVSASQFCTGALVAPDLVVTAAHCVEGKRADRIDVILDADNLCSPDPISGERVHVAAIEPFSSGADAALLRLVTASARHSPIALHDGELRPGNELDAWGWSSSSIGGASSCRVTTRPLRAVPLDHCRLELDAESAEIGSDADSDRGFVPARDSVADYLCALPTGTRNTCLGDSGGPLFTSDRHELAAITLSGRGCGANDPGLYLTATAIQRELAGR